MPITHRTVSVLVLRCVCCDAEYPGRPVWALETLRERAAADGWDTDSDLCPRHARAMADLQAARVAEANAERALDAAWKGAGNIDAATEARDAAHRRTNDAREALGPLALARATEALEWFARRGRSA